MVAQPRKHVVDYRLALVEERQVVALDVEQCHLVHDRKCFQDHDRLSLSSEVVYPILVVPVELLAKVG